jgi:ABC-type Fe3+ transport system substrate-binding protein
VEKRVRIVDFFPEDSHLPIVYPVAVTAHARPAARQFIEYLQSSPAQATFKKYGFQTAPQQALARQQEQLAQQQSGNRPAASATSVAFAVVLR